MEEDMDVSTTTPLSTMKGTVLVHPKYLQIVDQAQESDFAIPVIYRAGINKEPIEDWLENHKPSTICRNQGFGWIHIINQRIPKNIEGDIEGLEDAWDDLLASKREVCKERIFELAKNFRVLPGKWMFWVSPGGKGDHFWSLIAKGVASGKTLATHAKMSALEENTSHVVCIYNDNFLDEEEVYESERTIRSLGIKCSLHYKPDMFTYLGVYGMNPWGIRPTIYTSYFDILKNQSIIKQRDEHLAT